MAISRWLFAVVLLGSPALAQDGPLAPGLEDLPIGWSPEEEALRHTIGAWAAVTPPPVGPVRAAAEWDESKGVFCLWSNADLFDNLQQDNDIYVITQNQAWWENWLTTNGIPTTNMHYLNAPTNTFWVRDYGPWFIWDGNHDFGLVDNTYNRPRPLDDVVPAAIAAAYGVPFYEMDLIHTGGNYYADGYGTGLSTTLVVQENPTKTKAQIDQIVNDYLGIDRYMTPNIEYDIGHIDTFGKLLAPDSLIWGQFPENTTPWIYCEAAFKNLTTRQSPYGWPYRITRMPLFSYGSSWAGYINALQSNGKIFMASYGTANDAVAASIFEAAAPGYQVVPVNSGGTNWGDSVHCRTRNFMRGDAVRIYAMPHWPASDDDLIGYPVTAEVIPDNTTALAGNPEIRWTTTGGAPFSSVAMTPTGNPYEYAGTIPAQPHGTTVSYFVHAEDLAGRSKDAPSVAPAGMFSIAVADDLTRPELEHDAIHGLMPADWPASVTATALDDTGIPVLTLESLINGVPQATVVMTRADGSFEYSGTLVGSASLGDVISYRVVATDGASPANVATSPTYGWHQFPLTPANQILVIELDESPDSGAVLVDACDDLGLDVQYTSSWPASLAGYDTLIICLGMSPTNTALTTAQANALVSFLNAGGAAYMEGGNCWAQDSTAGIYRPYFGLASASAGANLGSSIVGLSGEVTDGMLFGYYGERNSSDHLTGVGAATELLASGGQTKALSYSTGTFDSVAASFQLGCLIDRVAPSHRKYLAALLLSELGTDLGLVVHNAAVDPLLLTADLTGDPGAGFMLFWALGPGYLPLGAKGILRLDPGTTTFLIGTSLGSNGTLRFDASVPSNPIFDGLELYLQGYRQNVGGPAWSLTNRDRITLAMP